MSKRRKEIGAEFIKNVASHQMRVTLDLGINRHLIFRRPDCGIYWFEIVTWPGRLAISGDMGDFVFTRLPDMFEFFRTGARADGALQVNLGYWGEKVTAECRTTRGVREFSSDLFRAAVVSDFKNHVRSYGIKPGLKQAIRDEVLSYADEGHIRAMDAAMNFAQDGFRLHDFYEHNVEDYTYHFTWCCYAIAWAIQQYDARRQATIDAEAVA